LRVPHIVHSMLSIPCCCGSYRYPYPRPLVSYQGPWVRYRWILIMRCITVAIPWLKK
jgi:hypothetical protein